ncbi:cysteine-rich repeat secretory protein 38-like [Neltuma alba]|uniref:cysteine-rich repeat secretory protein 38-like n=1 Tax=Neltuma alba TaxID=207710 RepID=UPI0010A57CAC|nr:cysteine-rich repeat secretory protein 38-like [Prosopis alba]
MAPSSKYQSNLKNLMSSLSSVASTSNGFGNRTADSSRLIQQHCPNNATAVLWYPFCLLRYSNQDFFDNLTLRPRIPMFDASQNFTSAGEFDSDATILMNGLIQTGSKTNLMFGTHVFNINGTQKRYGWVQCSRDITSDECRTCLSNMLEDVENCCEGKKGRPGYGISDPTMNNEMFY